MTRSTCRGFFSSALILSGFGACEGFRLRVLSLNLPETVIYNFCFRQTIRGKLETFKITTCTALHPPPIPAPLSRALVLRPPHSFLLTPSSLSAPLPFLLNLITSLWGCVSHSCAEPRFPLLLPLLGNSVPCFRSACHLRGGRRAADSVLSLGDNDSCESLAESGLGVAR